MSPTTHSKNTSIIGPAATQGTLACVAREWMDV